MRSYPDLAEPATDVEQYLDTLLDRLDLARKVRLLTGADFWRTHAEPEIGLRAMVLSDGPTGVRGERYDERDPSLCLPCPTALAASWDESLVRRAGAVLAAEARRKNVDILLGPTVNLQRSPYAGRHFECYSEDPLLSGRIGAALVAGVQGGGVAAAVKHFVGNDSETERFTVDVRMDPRTLREVSLAPFEHIVTGSAPWAVMAAYNKLDGVTMTESDLLARPLREEWGFDGLVVSDWYATRSTEATAQAGLDLVMPGPVGPWGEALIAAVKDGRVPEHVVDLKVRNLLRLAARVGALALPSAATYRVAADHTLLREAAAAGAVLLRNAGRLLPLDPSAIGSIAVIGPNAASARIQGGGSAGVAPVGPVSPLAGLRAAVGPLVSVTHAVGVHTGHRLTPITESTVVGPDGLLVRFYDADGGLLHTERRQSSRLLWFADPVTAGSAIIEATLVLPVEQTGVHEIGIAGVGPFELYLDDVQVLNVDLPADPAAGTGILNPPEHRVAVELTAGDQVQVRLQHWCAPEAFYRGFVLGLEPPRRPADAELDHAVALAAAADVAVVVVGTGADGESEGFDRTSLALPGDQDELVRRVAAANPRTIVVVNSGAPVLLPWRDQVPAVLATWFPGEQSGPALADLLFGRSEPTGRLPMTWPAGAHDAALRSTTPVDGVLRYDEGIHIGYRGWARSPQPPAYPFGYGLGYTTWEYVAIDTDEPAPDQPLTVRVTLRNTGERAGREVVQAYLSRESSAVPRPDLWLAGFAVATGEAGAEVSVELTIQPRAFEHWDGGWCREPGTYQLRVAPSATDPGLITPVSI